VVEFVGILIFARRGRRKKSGDGIDMEGFFILLIFMVIFMVLKFIVLIDAWNRCKTNSRKVYDRHEQQTIKKRSMKLIVFYLIQSWYAYRNSV
jgi:hypothetical protein